MADYTISQDLANVALGFKSPWFIVNASQAIGVYTSRDAARAAKAAGLAGKVVSLKEITQSIDAVEETQNDETPADPIVEIEAETETPAEVVETETETETETQVETDPIVEGKVETKVKTKAEPKIIENRSTAEKPCRLVWDLADSMIGARRKDVIAAAEAKGVAYYTARTQYQLWAQVQKEMADREKTAVKK